MNFNWKDTYLYFGWSVINILGLLALVFVIYHWTRQKKYLHLLGLFVGYTLAFVLLEPEKEAQCTYLKNGAAKFSMMDFGFFHLKAALEQNPNVVAPPPKLGCALQGFHFGYTWSKTCCKISPGLCTSFREKKLKRCYHIGVVGGALELRFLGICIHEKHHTPGATVFLE
jgi:hypothetical protein